MLSSNPIGAAFAAAIFMSALAVTAVRADPPKKLWERHPGSVEEDMIEAVASDLAGNVVVGGVTGGSIGKRNAGGGDALIIKYSPTGTVLWRRQPGSPAGEGVNAIAIDGEGNIAAAGTTLGSLFGSHAGRQDGFVISYTADGTVRWTQQFGAASHDSALSAAADAAGNVLVAGTLQWSAVLVKYDQGGIELWRRLMGNGSAAATAVAVAPSGSIIVAGETMGSFGGPNQGLSDAFVAAYSPEGERQWVRQFGTAGGNAVNGIAVAADGTIYAVGTDQNVAGFLAAFSPAGLMQWKVAIGRLYRDEGGQIGIDAAGNVVVTGIKALLPFVGSYTATGTPRWARTLPTNYNYSPALALDPGGNVLVAGTYDVPEARGLLDGYLVKFAE